MYLARAHLSRQARTAATLLTASLFALQLPTGCREGASTMDGLGSHVTTQPSAASARGAAGRLAWAVATNSAAIALATSGTGSVHETVSAASNVSCITAEMADEDSGVRSESDAAAGDRDAGV